MKRFLARKGVSSWHADDLVQETGLRLFKMWDDVDFLRSPRGLTFTIACNLLWDERNRKAGREVMGDVPEQVCDHDVERAGLARLELRRVRNAMAYMSPQQRRVLLAEIGHGVVPQGTPSAIKMVRMRARRRLSALLESAPAGAFAPLVALKTHLWRGFAFLRRHSTLAEMPVASLATMCGAIAVLILPGDVLPAPGRGFGHLEFAPAAAIQARAELSAVDPERVPAIRIAAPNRATAARGAPSRPPEEETDANVSFGGDDQPVEGGMAVDLDPDEDPSEMPECDVHPEENGVSYSCEVEAGGHEVKLRGFVEARP